MTSPLSRSRTLPRRLVHLSIVLGAALLCSTAAHAAEPAGAGWPPVVVDGPGALVIAGGGDLPATVGAKFVELAGGREARLVVIPTASARADRPEPLSTFVLWKPPAVASVVLLHTRNRAAADDPAFVKPLTEATGVWLSGGDQSLLATAYHGTRVEAELRRLLARGGVIGGTSAGAAVMSSVMIQGGTAVADVGQGFGLLSGVVIDTHFAQRQRLTRLLGVVAKYPTCVGLGIDEDTAIVVTGHNLSVLGSANVRVCKPSSDGKGDAQMLPAGSQADLLALTRPSAGVARGQASLAPKDKPGAVLAPQLLSP
jgi:cyanophycinase